MVDEVEIGSVDAFLEKEMGLTEEKRCLLKINIWNKVFRKSTETWNNSFKICLKKWHICDSIFIEYGCDMSHLWAGRKTRVHHRRVRHPPFFDHNVRMK